ncbi:MAG: nucleoside hydrolase [Ktedonobacteraceae bacterium]
MRQSPSYAPSEISQSRSKQIVLIDTDIGNDIDDALALALALRSPELDVRAVTTVFGNTHQRARLAAHLLTTFGHEDIPVAAGVQIPIQPRQRPSGVPQAAILDDHVEYPALSTLSGPELIIQTAQAHQGQLTLLCLGPLTNVAKALNREPNLFMAIRRIVMMGGTSSWPWPEWNIRSDARAAQIVLGAGIPVTMLGWNVTLRCQLQAKHIEHLRTNGSAQTQLLSQLLAIWQRHRPRWQPGLPYLHDPLVVAALCAPELLKFEEMTARVLAHGPFKGFMVARLLDGPLVHAAVNVQAEEVREWIMQRLLTPSTTQSS